VAFAAVYIPEFPIAAWLRNHVSMAAELKGHALAVVEGKPPLQRIVSIDNHARAQGVWTGMSRVQAETTGNLRFHERSLDEEQQAIDAVIKIAQRFSPLVQTISGPMNHYSGSRTPAALLLLDQGGTTTVFGPVEQYARKLRMALATSGFSAQIAVTPNAEASLLLARSSSNMICIGETELAQRLAPLPVSLLPCEDSILDIFARWGIRRLGELAALPAEALISRVGQQAERLQRLAMGTADHLLVPEVEAFQLQEQTELECPLEQLESLLFLISPMLDSLIRQAVECALALRSITVTLTLDKASPYHLQVRPALPTQHRDLLLKLLNLELQAHPPAAAILAVKINAEPTKPQTAQRGLFQAQFPEPAKLDLLLARLRSIVGDGNVGSPELHNSHGDDEFCIALFRPDALDLHPEQEKASTRLALRRFRPPQTARVQLRAATPANLFWQGQPYQIVSAKGPWESSGYWWDGRLWAAEEWDAVIATPAQALRLRREIESDTWAVTGVYD
jgi:protein ImuB